MHIFFVKSAKFSLKHYTNIHDLISTFLPLNKLTNTIQKAQNQSNVMEKFSIELLTKKD